MVKSMFLRKKPLSCVDLATGVADKELLTAVDYHLGQAGFQNKCSWG